MEVKVNYGLQNVYVAKRTVANGVVTYATPVAFPYAKSTDLAPEGETTDVYADNVKIYTIVSNQGYTGTLTFTNIPDWFRKEYLGDIESSEGILVENADAQPNAFALLFQFENDVKATRHIFYNCIATRPNVASATKEQSVTPNDNQLNIIARTDDELVSGKKLVKGKANDETDASVYTEWFTSVQVPVFTTPSA